MSHALSSSASKVCGALITALLVGCAGAPVKPPPVIITEYRNVPTPILTKRTPPPELTGDVGVPSALVFVLPTDPQASSALTPAGEAALVELVERYRRALAAWRAWAQ